jgi:hypothetical protein
MDNRPARHDGILDRVAITLSGLCLVHCLLLPTFIVALPLLTGAMAAKRSLPGA